MHRETTCYEDCGALSHGDSDDSPRSAARCDDGPQAVLGQAAASPSLRPRVRGESPAFEMKFLLDESRAHDIESRLATRLSFDSHCDPELGNAYRVTTVYCDTADLEVFHQIGSNRRRKYRVRRYGSEPRVFLERKTKQGKRVRKRRTVIDGRELPSLSSFSQDGNWPGHWFHERLLFRRLEPVCCVQYLRTAYVGADAEGPLRLTFDRDIRSTLVNDWTLALPGDGIPALTDQVVCEFKFRGALPALFKSVIQSLALAPAGVSKYRHCFRTAGGGGGNA
jgi:hypothetical protein